MRALCVVTAMACLEGPLPSGSGEPSGTVRVRLDASWCRAQAEIEVALVAGSGAELARRSSCQRAELVIPTVRYGRYDVYARICEGRVGWWGEAELWVDQPNVELVLSWSDDAPDPTLDCEVGEGPRR